MTRFLFDRASRTRSRAPWRARVGALSALGIAVLAVAGCGREEATASSGLTAEEFVDVTVELREAERAALQTDSAAELFARRKAEILERHGTSEEQIRAFAAEASRDLQEFADLWQEISDRLKAPAELERALD